MRRTIIAGFILMWSAAAALSDDEISVVRGLHVSITGGCHDCHTEGYSKSGGEIDPKRSLKGSTVGLRGPWGTTYPQNLRLLARSLSEDGYVQYLKNLQTAPPMPWWNVRQFSEAEIRSLYRYITALGDPGEPVPSIVPPDQEPVTAYIVIDPPHPGKACTRDLDCGLGQSCQGGVLGRRHASSNSSFRRLII